MARFLRTPEISAGAVSCDPTGLQAPKVEKEAFSSVMALQAPAAVLLDENMHVHRGKRADAPRAKPLKPSEKKPGLQERKALQDLSNVAEGTALKDRSMKEKSRQRKALQNVSNTIQSKDRPSLKEQRSTLKERSALGKQNAIKNPLDILTDEEIKKCHEWAKDGVEGAHFDDYQKSDKDLQDKRVKKKVATVLSALDSWSNVAFDRVMFPDTEVNKFFEEEKELQLEPEILPDISWGISHSGDDKAKVVAEDSFTDDELDQYPFLDNNPAMFELRDEPAIPQLGVY